jgi:hypothetical protein
VTTWWEQNREIHERQQVSGRPLLTAAARPKLGPSTALFAKCSRHTRRDTLSAPLVHRGGRLVRPPVIAKTHKTRRQSVDFDKISVERNPTSPQASFRTLHCLGPVKFQATRYPVRPGARGAVEQGPLAHWPTGARTDAQRLICFASCALARCSTARSRRANCG